MTHRVLPAEGPVCCTPCRTVSEMSLPGVQGVVVFYFLPEVLSFDQVELFLCSLIRVISPSHRHALSNLMDPDVLLLS